MMAKYLTTGPLVVVLPNVMDVAKRFHSTYNSVKEIRGEEDFPYTCLMGKGDELNYSRFPDLYYCAINYYKNLGALGGKNGRFVRSNLEIKTVASVLDKYCKIAAAGSSISNSQLQKLMANAEELGATVNEDVKRVKRRLKRKRSDSEDENE